MGSWNFKTFSICKKLAVISLVWWDKTTKHFQIEIGCAPTYHFGLVVVLIFGNMKIQQKQQKRSENTKYHNSCYMQYTAMTNDKERQRQWIIKEKKLNFAISGFQSANLPHALSHQYFPSTVKLEIFLACSVVGIINKLKWFFASNFGRVRQTFWIGYIFEYSLLVNCQSEVQACQ